MIYHCRKCVSFQSNIIERLPLKPYLNGRNLTVRLFRKVLIVSHLIYNKPSSLNKLSRFFQLIQLVLMSTFILGIFNGWDLLLIFQVFLWSILRTIFWEIASYIKACPSIFLLLLELESWPIQNEICLHDLQLSLTVTNNFGSYV